MRSLEDAAAALEDVYRWAGKRQRGEAYDFSLGTETTTTFYLDPKKGCSAATTAGASTTPCVLEAGAGTLSAPTTFAAAATTPACEPPLITAYLEISEEPVWTHSFTAVTGRDKRASRILKWPMGRLDTTPWHFQHFLRFIFSRFRYACRSIPCGEMVFHRTTSRESKSMRGEGTD